MDANTITQHLLSGQVGNPFEPGAYPGSVGNVGDLVNVMPFYPGMQQRVGSPNVQPFYPGVGAPAEQISAPPAANGLQYSQPVYPAGDVTYLGFGATTIPAGSVGTAVNVSTNRPFTPQKMGCPSTVIGLLITQVNVSGTNILANALGAPIELLSEVSTFPQVLWPSLDTATGVQFVVANPTVGDLIFSGAFYGPQLRR
jgi:hypothetical protein